jgi:hypothetical protein
MTIMNAAQEAIWHIVKAAAKSTDIKNLAPHESFQVLPRPSGIVMRGCGASRTRNDQPVIDCAHGYQKQNQEEADGVEENWG